MHMHFSRFIMLYHAQRDVVFTARRRYA